MPKLLYISNERDIKVCSQYFDSITVRSGVRQGCSLSPSLLAMCADILLRELALHLSGHEASKALADDAAAVVRDYEVSVPVMAKVFVEFAVISCLPLNVEKRCSSRCGNTSRSPS